MKRCWLVPFGKQWLTKVRFVVLAVLMIVTLYWTANCKKGQQSIHEQPAETRSKRFPTKIKLLLNNEICTDQDIFMIVVIHSASTHEEFRNTIRTTWGVANPQKLNIKVAFMLAVPSNMSIQVQLDKENRNNKDIVQGDFIDSYKNLTYKHIMGLQWVALYCPQAQFVMKMDDDIYVEIYQLVNLLQTKLHHLEKTIACYFQHQMPVVRDPSSKWFVTKDEFPRDTFEDYCSGWAYITDTQTAKLLSETALTVPYFWVDDVHITGTVAKKILIPKLRLNKHFALETQGLAEWTRSNKHMLWDRIFAPTWGDLTLIQKAHQKAKMCAREKCKCCFSKPPPPSTTTNAVPLTGRSFVKVISEFG